MGRQTQSRQGGSFQKSRIWTRTLSRTENTVEPTKKQHNTKLSYQPTPRASRIRGVSALPQAEEAVNCSSSQSPSTHQMKMRKQKKPLRCQHRSHKSYGAGSLLTMADMPRTRISCGLHLYPGQEAAHPNLQTELCVSSEVKTSCLALWLLVTFRKAALR